MPRKKLTINATNEQIELLYSALKVGTPLTIACSMAGISLTTFYYWVAIYSVVAYCKEQAELEQIEQLSQAGISIQEIKDLSATATNNYRKSAVGTYIEPKQETILQYKNSTKFRKFADQVYEIINNCNQIRSKVIVNHLATIAKSTDQKNRIRASGSMWFLERTQADYFGRPADKVVEEESGPGAVPPIQVEFVDPQTADSKSRLSDMEHRVLEELKGSGDA